MKELTIDEVRKIQLDILISIDEFCQNQGLRYSLAYGSLLGAVRHKGYIPWDDDIDIAMLRSDYEKFIFSFSDKNNLYKVAEARLDPMVNIGFAKVYDDRTIIKEAGNTRNLGIFVDVFPIESLCDTYDLSCQYFHSFDKIRFLQKVKGRELKTVKKIWKIPVIAFLKFCYWNINIHDLIVKCHNQLCHSKEKESKYVSPIIDGECKQREIVERKYWEHYTTLQFEGHEFMVVEDFDWYLKNEFGDYMQLPPKDQQVPKHDFDIVYWKEE